METKDYHDYIFKNGKLFGQFEEMYKEATSIPWHQDEQDNWLDIKLTISLLKTKKPYDFILDFGSGLGYFLNILKRTVASESSKMVGFDISKTACDKAKNLFPEYHFYVNDLMKKNIIEKQVNLNEKNKLFCIRGTLWYVYPEIENVVENISNHMKINDPLLVSQNFPPLDSNFVGKEIIPDHKAIINYFSKHFKVERSIWSQDYKSNSNDNWFICLFTKEKD
jgi:SAM-dependent methyltransferase